MTGLLCLLSSYDLLVITYRLFYDLYFIITILLLIVFFQFSLFANFEVNVLILMARQFRMQKELLMLYVKDMQSSPAWVYHKMLRVVLFKFTTNVTRKLSNIKALLVIKLVRVIKGLLPSGGLLIAFAKVLQVFHKYIRLFGIITINTAKNQILSRIF